MKLYLQSSLYPFFSFSVVFVIVLNIPTSSSQDDNRYHNCSGTFECGNSKNISYPFWGGNRAYYCGPPGFELICLEDKTMEINIMSQQGYRVLGVNQDDQVLTIARKDVWQNTDCNKQYVNISLDLNPFFYVATDVTLTLFYNCPSSISGLLRCDPTDFSSGDFHVALYSVQGDTERYATCETSVVFTVLQESVTDEGIQLTTDNTHQAIITVLRDGFKVGYGLDAKFCEQCIQSGGQCGYNWNLIVPTCFCPDGSSHRQCPKGNHGLTTILGCSIGGVLGFTLMVCAIFLICKRRKRHRSKSSALISRSITPDSSLKPDLEKGSSYFQTPIFTYSELQEATNNFDSSKELGDGGFGTVYHGNLRDGRVVAVKRLYENNLKRVEQFMNEITILSRLRHQNLVSLYGCTSRHSRELLLVYEFVPNGTVADHLHGDRANTGLLTWPIRISIAIESADALAYLHASDTIHRDVKTNNILLDKNFHVKVADFGLSRLFPNDVSHVSTAPQGTPGYVDPEYYQCYQLNGKSDVYSFGVVLIELISAKPAVDISRHRHEINLSTMAITKIHNDALHELVDPSLGFESDHNVRRSVTMVAELAFRCLQQENDMRPCMVEVLKTLKEIENEGFKTDKAEEVDISADARLLKTQLFSPNAVTDKWASISTTPNTSG